MADEAANGKRVALVIGNGAYTHAAFLANPANDARGMTQALEALGFAVAPGIDLARDAMENAFFDFEAAIRDAEVALFFYAGHGLQVQGENYLLPVDANIEMEMHLKRRAFSLSEVLGVMRERTPTNLIFLDACRSNPFTRSLARTLGLEGERTLCRGLAEVRVARGTFIAFATSPNEVAPDGKGKNSLFTAALLKHIGTPGLSITDMMTDVTNEVAQATKDKQEPWQQSSLRAKFYFRPPEAPIPTGTDPVGSRLALAAAEWGQIKDTRIIAKLKRFAEHFRGTYYTELAVERIAELEEADRAKATAEAEAQAKAEAERKRAEAKGAEIRDRIAGSSDRDALFALWQEDPEAVTARLKSLGFVRVPSLKDGKPVSYWLKSGESFRDLYMAPEMVVIPPGEFQMGSNGEGSDYGCPQHKVTIPQAFAVGRYPVTFTEWDEAIAQGGVSYKPHDQGWGRGRRPVINVSWDDVQAYVQWLSARTGQSYRLLSEAEWEYACRAGSQGDYCFGRSERELVDRLVCR
jgi:uncharacterized caspase-like protein